MAAWASDAAGGGGDAGAVATMAGGLAAFGDALLAQVRALIAAALVNHRPRGLAAAVFSWDSGAAGTPLTASATRPNGWVAVPFPAALQDWELTSYPSGSATVLLKYAAPGAALASATTLATLTISSDTDAQSSGFTEVNVEAGGRLAAFLTAVTTTEVLNATATLRRR